MRAAVDLTGVAEGLFATAWRSTDGRSSISLHPGEAAVLRQTVVGLLAGRTMTMGHPPQEGTILVIEGRVTVEDSEDTIELDIDDLLVLPSSTLTVTAMEHSALLLTVAMGSRP